MGCRVEGEFRASRSPAPSSPRLSISQQLAAPLSLQSYRAPQQNRREIIVCLLLGPRKSKEKMRFCLLALDHGVFLPCRAGFHVPLCSPRPGAPHREGFDEPEGEISALQTQSERCWIRLISLSQELFVCCRSIIAERGTHTQQQSEAGASGEAAFRRS